MVVQVVYNRYQPAASLGLIGGCSLGRCLMGAFFLWYVSIACGHEGVAMMISRGCNMGFHSMRYRMDSMGVSSSSSYALFTYLGVRYF
jgi:hypothetical protein